MLTKTKLLKTIIFTAVIVSIVIMGYLFLSGKIKKETKTEWKTFSFNGNAFRFKYPAKWCDDKDCRNLYAVSYEDVVFIGQNQPSDNISDGYIDPILPIYYVSSIDQGDAEKYLKNKYEPSEAILWTADKNNPEVEFASVVAPHRIYGAYSKEIKTLVFFSLPLACLFDCQIDKEVINSIEVNGVKVYQE